MTDKQIINKCGFCDDDKYCRVYPYTCDFNYYCNDNEDCPVKNILSELQAKEQECERLKETFDGLFKVQYKLADSCKKLRQTLTEIKEIAEKRNYLDYNECLDDILQKISECEGNNE